MKTIALISLATILLGLTGCAVEVRQPAQGGYYRTYNYPGFSDTYFYNYSDNYYTYFPYYYSNKKTYQYW